MFVLLTPFLPLFFLSLPRDLGRVVGLVHSSARSGFGKSERKHSQGRAVDKKTQVRCCRNCCPGSCRRSCSGRGNCRCRRDQWQHLLSPCCEPETAVPGSQELSLLLFVVWQPEQTHCATLVMKEVTLLIYLSTQM